jgi:hypothetical protein
MPFTENVLGEPCPYWNATNKPMSLKIPRRQYADLYGPTTGDRVRLADTELFIEIEKDLTTPGEEAKFGGGTGTDATTCTSGAWNIHRMLESADGFPVNLGFLGNSSSAAPLRADDSEQIAFHASAAGDDAAHVGRWNRVPDAPQSDGRSAGWRPPCD